MVAHYHRTLVRGAGESARAAGRPVILKRTDEDFVAALLDELGDRGGLEAALARTGVPRPNAGGRMALFQPVHRVFHVVLVEAVCDRVGTPRLDPAKIESAGLVMRRRAVDARGRVVTGALEAWVQEAPTPKSRAAGAERPRAVRGWVPFAARTTAPADPRDDINLDPDPARRPAVGGTGRPELDLRLMLGRAGGPSAALAETVIPLFPVPPEVYAATGRTLLFGVLSTASSETSEGPEPEIAPAFDAAELTKHLPQIVRGGLQAQIPKPGDWISWAEANAVAVPDDIKLFVTQLRQLAVEAGLLEGEETELKKALDAVQLRFYDETRWPWGTTAEADRQRRELEDHNQRYGHNHELEGVVWRGAGTFLRAAIRALVEGDDRQAVVRMPIKWVQPTPAQAQAIAAAAGSAMLARLRTMMARAPRFADPAREYHLRAFVRLRPEAGGNGNGNGAADSDEACDCCRQAIAWSDYSDPFTIVPWYAPSGAAPTLIPLPDAMDRAALKQLKPNVAFAVPKKLADFLNGNDPKALLKGEGSDGASGIALDWICGFNIPIITICAFIALSIILGILDFFLRWMMFVKICLPIPRLTSSGGGGGGGGSS